MGVSPIIMATMKLTFFFASTIFSLCLRLAKGIRKPGNFLFNYACIKREPRHAQPFMPAKKSHNLVRREKKKKKSLKSVGANPRIDAGAEGGTFPPPPHPGGGEGGLEDFARRISLFITVIS